MLVDPWLVGTLSFGEQTWLLESSKYLPPSVDIALEGVDAILLSQSLDDHTHVPTLKALPKNIPILAQPAAARIAIDLGFTSVRQLDHGEEVWQLACHVFAWTLHKEIAVMLRASDHGSECRQVLLMAVWRCKHYQVSLTPIPPEHKAKPAKQEIDSLLHSGCLILWTRLPRHLSQQPPVQVPWLGHPGVSARTLSSFQDANRRAMMLPT